MSPAIRLSAVVPARNEEATIAACVESLAAQPEIGEIIAVNDQSSDRTGEILRELAGRIPRLQVLEAGALPSGWIGKNYAVAVGAARAVGEWLLFFDADAVLVPGGVQKALRAAETAGAALVSYSPEQVTETWWEKAIIPFVYTRLSRRYPFEAVSDPASPSAAANGQFLLIRRDAYEVAGGHAAGAGEMVEDVALATRVKHAGYRLRFSPGNGVVRVRMYRKFTAMWEGWTKNLYLLMGGSHRLVGQELLTAVPWISMILLALGVRYPWLLLPGLLLLAVRHAAYAAALRHNQAPVSRIIYYVPAVLLYGAALVASMRRYANGYVAWKGREYAVGGAAR
jgi:cellulose synthase/poly-beta-1,6-N-acetylglucosamine synthase-like glycosyltransferase